MASASTTEPIFNDTESDAINDYFATLIRNQSLNGWSANYSTNYLQLKDLKYLHDFIAGKINNKKNLSVKGSFTTSLKTSLKKIFKKKTRKIVPKTNNNNNKTRNKYELLKVTNLLSGIIEKIKTNNTDLIDLEFITLINDTIDRLINTIILSNVYFKQEKLSTTFTTSTTSTTSTTRTFNFITDSFLTYIINDLYNTQRLQKDTQKTQKMLIKHQNIQLNPQTNNMSDLFQNFKKTFGRQAVANNTTIPLEEHKSKMIELYKEFERIFGRKAWTHTVVGGMQKKQKKPNYKLSTHKSIKHTTSPYKKNNHKTLKRIKLINKH